MNCRNKFKLTAIAMMVGSSMSANAALYQVIEVSPEDHGSNGDYRTAYGVAIQQGDVESSEDLGCFDSAVGCTKDTFKLAIETRTTRLSSGQAVDGVSYREEVPFGMDARFSYIDDEDDFESYCYYYLGYNTCETWASVNYAPWRNEYYYKDFTSNALAFVEDGEYSNEFNNVINSLYNNSLTGNLEPVGNQSVVIDDQLETRNTVVAPVVPTTDSGVESRAWKTDGTFTVGSISRPETNTNGRHHTSKAAIWDSEGYLFEVPWRNNDRAEEDERLAQGSMRDFTVDGNKVYGVGYNTYDSDRNQLNATVFVGTLSSESSIQGVSFSSKEVSGARQREDGDNIHSNSRLTGVNEKFVGIGEAKRSVATAGAYPNRLFIVKDVRADSLSATYLNSGIFFSGAGGKMGGINKYSEIVGQLDADSTREDDGKPRRKRGFIYPYNVNGSVTKRLSLFNNRAWFLDDLTNGGDNSDSNNEYRIIDATDINDAGVIAGTALKCEGGYDTTAHNSYCSNGEEKVVAVKLLPVIQESASIQTRSVEQASATREGAGLGWLALTMLGLFGFRRK